MRFTEATIIAFIAASSTVSAFSYPYAESYDLYARDAEFDDLYARDAMFGAIKQGGKAALHGFGDSALIAAKDHALDAASRQKVHSGPGLLQQHPPARPSSPKPQGPPKSAFQPAPPKVLGPVTSALGGKSGIHSKFSRRSFDDADLYDALYRREAEAMFGAIKQGAKVAAHGFGDHAAQEIAGHAYGAATSHKVQAGPGPFSGNPSHSSPGSHHSSSGHSSSVFQPTSHHSSYSSSHHHSGPVSSALGGKEGIHSAFHRSRRSLDALDLANAIYRREAMMGAIRQGAHAAAHGFGDHAAIEIANHAIGAATSRPGSHGPGPFSGRPSSGGSSSQHSSGVVHSAFQPAPHRSSGVIAALGGAGAVHNAFHQKREAYPEYEDFELYARDAEAEADYDDFEIYARDAEAEAEAEYDDLEIYARDAEPEADAEAEAEWQNFEYDY
jgi:hypothetical protein